MEEEAGTRAMEGAAGSGECRNRARCAPCMGLVSDGVLLAGMEPGTMSVGLAVGG